MSLITKNDFVLDNIVLCVHLWLAVRIQTVREDVLDVVLCLPDERGEDGSDGGHVEEDQVRVAMGDVDKVVLVDRGVCVQEDLVFCAQQGNVI